MPFMPLISKNSLNLIQILKEETHYPFKKNQENEALEQKLVSPDNCINNTQKYPQNFDYCLFSSFKINFRSNESPRFLVVLTC